MVKFPVAWTYVVASLAVIGGMVYDEGSRHRAFFPTVTALSSNNLFHVALANGFFAALYATCWLFMRTFLGKLDQTERLSATEKFFGCFLDAVLGLAIFRTSFNYWTVVQVTCTLAWRMLHHLATARQESMEQAVTMTLFRTLRFTTLLTLLFIGDVAISIYFFDTSRRDGIGLPTLLCVDFMVMGVIAVSVACKFLFQLYEQFRGGIWEPRGTYRFYCDIATEALSCAFYIGFFVVVTRYTTTPFHIVRHLIDNVRRLTRAVRDCATYRSLVAKLARLADPTPEQLANDGTCSVCLGDIETPVGAKRLPCGHSFHSQCLTRWLERNNNCPYCRQELEAMLARVPAAAPPAAAAAAAPPPVVAGVAAGGDGAGVGAGGAMDPFAALQDDEAIRRMYAQYLRMHREVVARHENRDAVDPALRQPQQQQQQREAANEEGPMEPPNRDASPATAPAPAPAAAAAGAGAEDSTKASAALDTSALVADAPASAAASDEAATPQDPRRAAAAAAEARARALRRAAEQQQDLPADANKAASAGPTRAPPSTTPAGTATAGRGAADAATVARLERRLAAFEAYRATIQEAERSLDAALAEAS